MHSLSLAKLPRKCIDASLSMTPLKRVDLESQHPSLARVGPWFTIPSMFKRILLLIVFLASAAAAKEQKFLKPGPVHVGDDARKWAGRTLKKMTLEQKVGQIIFVQQQARFMNVDSPEHQRLRDLIRRFHLGGINLSVAVESGVLMKTLPYEAAVWTNTLQND